MEKHPQNNLRKTLQDKLYNAKVDAEDLSWSEFETKLTSRNSIFNTIIPVWVRAVAALLLVGFVSYYMSIPSDNISSGLTSSVTEKQDEITKNTEILERNQDYIASTESSEVLSKTEESSSSSIHNSMDFKTLNNLVPNSEQDVSSIVLKEQDMSAGSFDNSQFQFSFIESSGKKLTTLSIFNEGIDGGVGISISDLGPVNVSMNNVSANEFNAESQFDKKRSRFKFNSVIVGFKPLMQYNQIQPVKNDLLYLKKIQNTPSFDLSRMGFNFFTAFQMDFSKSISFYSGASYLFQRNNVHLEGVSVISNDTRDLKYDTNSHGFGIQAGIKTKLFEKSFTTYSLVIENEYQRMITESKFMQPNRLTMSFGYEISVKYSPSATINFQPVFTYSFKESENRNFASKPYWFGMEVSLTRNFNSFR